MNRNFYFTKEWRIVRYMALRDSNGWCHLCGRSAKDGIKLHVDHIVPVSKDPGLALILDNLQVLCEDCNLGKLNTDSIRWKDHTQLTGKQRRRLTRKSISLLERYPTALSPTGLSDWKKEKKEKKRKSVNSDSINLSTSKEKIILRKASST